MVRSSCVFNFCNVLAKDLIFDLKVRSSPIFTPKYREFFLLSDTAGLLHSQSFTMFNSYLVEARLVYINLDFFVNHT